MDSADEVSQRVHECGGTVAVGPLQAEQAGRPAMAADVSGAVFGLWQGEEHLGWQVADWNHLAPDVPTAAAFYRGVLGRQPSPRPDGSADLLVDGEPVVGIHCGTAPGWPHWQVHFAVTDADLTVRQAVGLGGQVLDGPEETPYGRAARPADPQGGRFSVIEVG
ncbi:VOC family protein [Streptomyces sp. H10-C2]|uniref:VOC family protein n=1 Tax=unclassified Streptomyces TaxID=2593676 RepID=UPI0024B92745|nr:MULTISPECIES: VOC family protein [unclassified Streptomyces]MDJ0347406.1 VOC family protein [Streptomyces sp. PH10-H1]MDJ0375698.1 VOC family protein [Streptomyces sp. H10-C2]